MTEKSFYEYVLNWLSSRRMNKFMQHHPGSRTVVPFRSCSLFAGPGNKIEATLLRGEKYYDGNNFTAVNAFVQKGAVCCDIGANIGVYSNVMARISGNAANIHAFEPVDHIRRRLVANARLNGFRAMNINAFALGDQPGTLEMQQVKEGQFRGGTSTFTENENIAAMGDDAFEKRNVEIRTLDHYVSDHDLERLDFVKIDVEGFELKVLTGGAATLARFKPAILFEYEKNRHGQQDQGPQIRDLLTELDYSVNEFVSFRDKLVMRPFDFKGQPFQRNLLALDKEFEV